MDQTQRRYELDRELRDILGSDNVYFQPPEGAKLKYDCIVYNIDDVDIRHANNNKYGYRRRYSLLAITKKPDSDLAERIVRHFIYCSIDRVYKNDNLNHTHITLYY